MSWKEALKADPSDWLLEPQDPCVRFWAMQGLEGKASNDPEVLEAQVALMATSPVRTILDAQEPEGYWVHRADMYLPTYYKIMSVYPRDPSAREPLYARELS